MGRPPWGQQGNHGSSSSCRPLPPPPATVRAACAAPKAQPRGAPGPMFPGRPGPATPTSALSTTPPSSAAEDAPGTAGPALKGALPSHSGGSQGGPSDVTREAACQQGQDNAEALPPSAGRLSRGTQEGRAGPFLGKARGSREQREATRGGRAGGGSRYASPHPREPSSSLPG